MCFAGWMAQPAARVPPSPPHPFLPVVSFCVCVAPLTFVGWFFVSDWKVGQYSLIYIFKLKIKIKKKNFDIHQQFVLVLGNVPCTVWTFLHIIRHTWGEYIYKGAVIYSARATLAPSKWPPPAGDRRNLLLLWFHHHHLSAACHWPLILLFAARVFYMGVCIYRTDAIVSVQ